MHHVYVDITLSKVRQSASQNGKTVGKSELWERVIISQMITLSCSFPMLVGDKDDKCWKSFLLATAEGLLYKF